MMPVRYLACVSTAPSAGPPILPGIPGFQLIYEGARSVVLCDGRPDVHLAMPGQGVLVGRLFERLSGKLVSSADAGEISSRKRTVDTLLDHYWGGYVALFDDPDAGAVRILRDPGGLLPAYVTRNPGQVVVASDVELLIEAGLRPSLDHDYLADHLRLPQMRTARTGIRGVGELLPGMEMSVGPHAAPARMAWSPWSFAAAKVQFRDHEEACDAVRDAVMGAVRSLASNARAIMLGVSGGLDSSIVAAALKACGARLHLYTLVTGDPGGDERRYAGALAEHLGVALEECPERPEHVDCTVSQSSHLPRPVARSFAQSGNAHAVRLQQRFGADAFFSGGGGDSAFCYLTSTAPVVDRLHSEGICGGWLRTARDMSRLTEVSLSHVLCKSAPKWWQSDRCYRWREDSSFLPPERHASPLMLHPWASAPNDALRGKAAHVAWLLGIQNYLEGFAHEQRYPVIFPLVSQPVMETCLRVPSWMWCDGGRNRAVARDAFKHLLPPSILRRRSKGSFDGFVREILLTKLEPVRAMLLEGQLAHLGLVDRAAVERALAAPDTIDTLMAARLMTLVDVEAWATSWSSWSLLP